MGLDSIIKSIRENKLDLEDKGILKSKEFEEYIKSISNKLYEKYDLNQDKLKFLFDKNIDDVSYIKRDTIYINLYSNSISEGDKFKLILGYYAHEIGHRLFTDFTLRDIYEQSILSGSLRVDSLEFDDEESNENIIKMQSYINNTKKSGKLCSLLLFIYDIIEDSRVEESIYEYLSNYGRLIDGLNELRDAQYKSIKNFKVDLIDNKRFNALINQIICYIKFRKFKDISDYDIKNIEKIKKEIDESIYEEDGIKVIDRVNKINILMWDEIEEYLQEFDDVYKEELDNIKPIKSLEIEKNLDENSQATSSIGQTHTRGEICKTIKSNNDIKEQPKKELVKSENEDTMEINSDKNSSYKSTMVRDKDALKLRKSSNEDSTSDYSISKENEELFYGVYNNKNSFGKGIMKLRNIKENNDEQPNDSKLVLYGDIHKNIRIKVHRPEFTYEDKLNYKQDNKKYIKAANELANQVLPFLKNEVSSEYSRNRYYGTKFDASNVAKKDYRYFSKKNPPNESPSMAVGLRIDESGSMKANNRIEVARATAILIWEFCKKCDIPIGIYGDTADISDREDVSIYSYSDFDNQDKDDCYRMMQISAKSNNRDGVPIKYAAEKLLKVDADIKVLFIISDGKPLAKPNYKDELAKEDLRSIISEYSRKGIHLFVSAIGNDRDVIKDIYGEHRFLDISNINTLPNRISIILKNLL
ncbi:nitric oxide reductase activation protein NorD [Paraclostridium bifermentans]|uniref:vWA domain-containing protein n=1 Tax=Paraclostridium bifermentans TaxID=1490 RepID=UPI00290C1B3C|nr:nitric oxide reductase activation protein NorD [Paraclostridium bifermentans]MDU3336356.1 nitric oxide reductase activation protein NorD [Paraclostridium bifermentans]